MNVSRILITAASALSVLAMIGCSSTRSAPEVVPAPMVVEAPPPAPVVVVVAEPMPSPPALQNDAPVIVSQAPVMTMPAQEFTERPPQADRN
jgi:hypothetical protein